MCSYRLDSPPSDVYFVSKLTALEAAERFEYRSVDNNNARAGSLIDRHRANRMRQLMIAAKLSVTSAQVPREHRRYGIAL